MEAVHNDGRPICREQGDGERPPLYPAPMYPRPSEDVLRPVYVTLAELFQRIHASPGRGPVAEMAVLVQFAGRGVAPAAFHWALHELSKADVLRWSYFNTFEATPALWGFQPEEAAEPPAAGSEKPVDAGPAEVQPPKTDPPEREQPRSREQSKLFPGGIPDRIEIKDLVCEIDAAKGSGKTRNAIAEAFTGGKKREAQSLLATIRRLVREGKICLD